MLIEFFFFLITVAPHNDICPHGRTYPIHAVAVVKNRITTATDHVCVKVMIHSIGLVRCVSKYRRGIVRLRLRVMFVLVIRSLRLDKYIYIYIYIYIDSETSLVYSVKLFDDK